MRLAFLKPFPSPFLVVTSSLWPLLIRFRLLCLVLFFLLFLARVGSLTRVLFSMVSLITLSLLWWRDLVRESILGSHTSKLEIAFRCGIVLFILSEILFFMAFFWAFYDRSLSPSIDIGMSWPPKGVLPLRVYSVPLLNTIILLSSGVTVTWAHHSLVCNQFGSSLYSLTTTVVLGVYFLGMQYEEYQERAFSMSDGVYGSTFFIRTGFHGAHVIVGTLMLRYSLINLGLGKLTFNHHFIFEAAAWYWHFVDVVWLLLYISIYWWGAL